MSILLGWEVQFEDETNNKTYTSEIVDLAIGLDVASSIVMCTLKYSVDSSLNKYFLKPHEGTLTIINKLIYSKENVEMFKIKLQSVSNNGTVSTREPEVNRPDVIIIPVQYMCKEGVKLLNARVGNVYYKKKIEDIIQDLYSQTDCELPLKLEKLNNQKIYENIEVQEGSFIESIRYLNQQYGLYDNLMLMFGDTLSDESFNWVINNINKINREEVTLNYIQFDQIMKKDRVKSIDERHYYTYIPINVYNNFTSASKQIPQLAKIVTFDNERFMKRKDIPFARTLKEMNFINTNDQYDKLMELSTKLFVASNLDLLDYSYKNIMQKVGLSTYQVPEITIPNPFKLAHFKIGTPINFISNNEVFMDMDVKLIVLGWYLKLFQEKGSLWSSTLQIRVASTSYKDINID